MKITKYTHSCVKIEHPGGVLVIDPGVWSEPRAVDGADAVLVTHEHSDHIDVRRLSTLGIPVYMPAGARVQDLEVVPVHPGEVFTAGGMEIEAVGGRHAPTYATRPDCVNVGYIVDHRCYHPGDSLHVPQRDVDILLTPVHGSWMKTAEAIDYAKYTRSRHVVAIHEGQINQRGLSSVDEWFTQEIGNRYQRLEPGEFLSL
ncbi:L-ascorbate metabolism protein UlaG (beta-lactamase superfamily) [Nonomuraea thailandensis]|uniref:L-ascorbate metabolism protein UlaG (Beta-lactamase superfamily) n=1 Tax=Nonomuraea thailandensis TaxID=1188745 RepID=A0A9X2JXZ7_9ACTN|nr:MBL fold metallo-hydrolase [Nonomuraea thailandensis]MCP2353273.1 L-ascorbate metabolism protein UlaG (beta-lactamase superfamily) [Nonomuraea thailandensis]